jgi:hypothetical protein
MYLRKSAQLSAYLDEHHPQFWDRPDLLRWSVYAVDGPRRLRVRQLSNLIFSSFTPKTADGDRRLKVLVIEVRCIMIAWLIVWTLTMICVARLPFHPPAPNPYIGQVS